MKVEIWKDVVGYEGLYMVSQCGKIKSVAKDRFMKLRNCYAKRKEIILKARINPYGYFALGLWKGGKATTFRVHRIVAIAFIPNPKNKPQINHINGIKTDNRVENLEWNTSKENIQHAFDNGLKTARKGISSSTSKLSEEQVLEIRNSDLTQKNLADIYKVNQALVSRIKSKKVWKHI